MEGFFLRRVNGRCDSQGVANKSLINPRAKLLSESARLATQKKPSKTERPTENSDSQKEALTFVLHELEARLGFSIPKESLKQAAEALKEKLAYKIACSVTDLVVFSKKLEKLLQELETFPCRQWSIELAGHVFELSVNDWDSGLSKEKLSENFQLSYSSSQLSPLRISSSIINLCQDYEESLQAAFDSCKKISNSKPSKRLSKKSLFLIKSEIEESNRRKQEYLGLKQDLQWQKEELKFVISQAKHQKNENAAKENLLDAQLSNLRTRRIALAQEQENLEMQQGKINCQKQVLHNICKQLDKFLGSLDSKPRAETKNIAEEVGKLEKSLRELETMQKKCSGTESESLATQINRLKTRISSLKSIKALNNSVNSSNSAKNLMQSFNKVYSINGPDHRRANSIQKSYHLGLSSKLPKSETQTCSFSTLRTERSLSVDLMSYKQKDETNPNVEYLKHKEMRLIEKEEELDFIEEKIIKKLGNSDKVNDVKVLKAETGRFRKKLENRQKVLESEEEDLEKGKMRLKDLEKEVEKKMEEVDCEVMKVIEEKARVVRIVEEIKEYLEGKIDEIS